MKNVSVVVILLHLNNVWNEFLWAKKVQQCLDFLCQRKIFLFTTRWRCVLAQEGRRGGGTHTALFVLTCNIFGQDLDDLQMCVLWEKHRPRGETAQWKSIFFIFFFSIFFFSSHKDRSCTSRLRVACSTWSEHSGPTFPKMPFEPAFKEGSLRWFKGKCTFVGSCGFHVIENLIEARSL